MIVLLIAPQFVWSPQLLLLLVFWSYQMSLGKGSTAKKRFLSGIAQITSPLGPQFRQHGPLFWTSKFKMWKSIKDLEYPLEVPEPRVRRRPF